MAGSAPRTRVRRTGTVVTLALLAALAVAATTLALVLPHHASTPGGTSATGQDDVRTVSYLRVPESGDDFPRLPQECYDANGEPLLAPCHITRLQSRRTIVVWGDSHAWMYLPALRAAALRDHVDLVLVVAGGCPPAMPAPGFAAGDHTRCETHDAATLDYIRRLHQRGSDFAVILGAFWSGYRTGTYLDSTSTVSASSDYAEQMITLAEDGTEPLFAALGRLGARVDVIGQAATVPENAPACPAGDRPYLCDLPRSAALPDEASNRQWLRQMMGHLRGHPRYLDPSSVYCDASACHPQVAGVDTFYDDIHLGATLTARMTRYFLPAFDDLGGAA